MQNNGAVFEDYHHIFINFKKLLLKNNFIIFKNCSDLTIIISSNISRIEFINCNNIVLFCNKIFGGIISNNSSIHISKNNTIYNIEATKSHIKLKKIHYKNIIYFNQYKSNIIIY